MVTAGVYQDRGLLFFINSGITDVTRNECEWEAVVHAMHVAGEFDPQQVSIYTDSLIVYRQLNFINHINKKLKPRYFKWNRMKNKLCRLSGFEIDYNYVSGSQNPARRYLNKIIVDEKE